MSNSASQLSNDLDSSKKKLGKTTWEPNDPYSFLESFHFFYPHLGSFPTEVVLQRLRLLLPWKIINSCFLQRLIQLRFSNNRLPVIKKKDKEKKTTELCLPKIGIVSKKLYIFPLNTNVI